MALVIADRVRETTTTTGTGAVTLAGPYTSFQAFSAAVGNGNSTYYTIASAASGEWEVGIGTYSSSGNTLSRTTVLSSSNAGSLVNFSAGAKDVFVTQPSERSLLVQSAGSGLFSSVAAFTANGVPYADSTSTLATSSSLTFDGTTLTAPNITSGGSWIFSGGTANGVLYLNGSKVATSGSALTFASSTLTVNNTVSASNGTNIINVDSANQQIASFISGVGYGTLNLNGSPLVFQITGSEAMRLTSTGLGIGTSSPDSKLSVAGAIKSTGNSSVTASANSAVLAYVAGSTARLISYGPDTSTPGAIQFVGLSSNAGSGDVRATIDSSGNLGLGVTPSAWGSGYKFIQIGNGAGANGAFGVVSNNLTQILTNTFYNGSNYVYLASSIQASAYNQTSGQHQWYTAPSGTAGNAISFTQALTLDASGNLLVGATSTYNSNKFYVNTGSAANAAFFSNNVDATFQISLASGLTKLDAPTGTLTLLTSGSERARIDTSGRFGIGTTGPSAELHVLNASGNSGLGSDNTGMALVESTYGSTGSNSNASFVAKNLFGYSQFMQWENYGVRIGSRGTANGGAGDVVFTYGNDSEGMRLTSTGLGIGTSSPYVKLQVTGTIKVATGNAQGILSLGDGNGVTTNVGLWRGAANAPTTDGNFLNLGGYEGMVFAVGAAAIGSQSEAMRLTSTSLYTASGINVGIGTSSPWTKLSVYGSGNQRIAVTSPTGGATVAAIDLSPSLTAGEAASYDPQARIYAVDSNYSANIIFANKATGAVGNSLQTRMTLDTSGNLGLGVAPSAWASGQVAIEMGGTVGNLAFNSSGATHEGYLYWNSFYNGTNTLYKAAGYAIAYGNNNGEHRWFNAPSWNGTGSNIASFTQAMTLDASGNLGLGTTSPAQRLDVSSASTSDTDLKYNFVVRSTDAYSTTPQAGIAFATYFNGTQNLPLAGIYGGKENATLNNFASKISFATRVDGGNITERARIDSSGNFGIGTSSPGQKLHVDNTANSSTWIKVSNGSAGSGAAAGVLFGNDGGDLGAISLLSSANSPASALFLRSLSTNPLVFGTNNTERARISSDGTFNIGTTTGVINDGNLVVAGSIGTGQGAANTVAQINIWETTSGNKAGLWFGAMTNSNVGVIGSRTASGAIAFQTYNSGWAERARIDSSGNLGIGTTSPQAKLEIYPGSITSSAAQEVLRLDVPGSDIFSAASGYINFRGYDVSNSAQRDIAYIAAKLQPDTSGAPKFGGNLLFYTCATGTSQTPQERGRFDSAGNFLVGTTSNKGLGITAESTSNTIWATCTVSGQSALVVQNTNGGAVNLVAFQTGSGFGTGVGSIYYSAGLTVYATTSDYRLKNVIGEVTGSGARIDALEPVEYEWKSSGERTRGFLAHKFQEVYPQSVSGEKDAVDENGNPKYQHMQASTSEVIADLVAEIKSLRSRVAQLESN